MFYKEILQPILSNMRHFEDRNAFVFGNTGYSYYQLKCKVCGIKKLLQKVKTDKIGLVINNDISTYASILALWFDGKCYVPLHPEWPLERCLDICEQVDIQYILDSSEMTRYKGINVIATADAKLDEDLQCEENVSNNELAYILFTSGSTGKPKGVPISRGNLASFVNAFWNIGFKMNEEDRCLQCFDLTFDLSVMSYLIPLIVGAGVYTVPYGVVKYVAIPEILEEFDVTVALMAPSTINYLKPYLDEIELPKLRYSLFCGEALRDDVTYEWSKSVPNAEIYNVYGPTEDTIFCTYYKYDRSGSNKIHNGVLSIGKTMTSGDVKVLDEQGNEVAVGELGELCLYGKQLFKEYWKNEEKTREVFVNANDGRTYYKSGDICFRDADGDIMYSGRKDHQAKIQGFRVELGEIECHIRTYLRNVNVVCTAYSNSKGIDEIVAFIEMESGDTKDMMISLKSKMPAYMIPSKVIYVSHFPLNANGKIDRNSLKQLIK